MNNALNRLAQVHNARRHVEPAVGTHQWSWSLKFFWETLASGTAQTQDGCRRAMDTAVARILREIADELEGSAFMHDQVQSHPKLAYDGFNKEQGAGTCR
jgi:hypothetical protein